MAKDRKKGLGTGLGALFGEELAAEPAVQEQVITELPVMKIEPRSDQPRRHFDEQALQELAESIEQHGMIQPITVRPQPSGYYQIIAGERRWRAARKAGLETVPVYRWDTCLSRRIPAAAPTRCGRRSSPYHRNTAPHSGLSKRSSDRRGGR